MKAVKTSSSILKGRIPAVAITVFALVAVAMLLSSGLASAGGPKVIRGYIKDNAGNPLQGTNVVLEVRTPSNVLRYTDSYTTGGSGFYSFTLDSFTGQWADGDTFKIIATYSGNQKIESALDDGTPLQIIDVTFPFEIPQFGSILGFGIALLAIGLVAMVFIVKRKKN